MTQCVSASFFIVITLLLSFVETFSALPVSLQYSHQLPLPLFLAVLVSVIMRPNRMLSTAVLSNWSVRMLNDSSFAWLIHLFLYRSACYALFSLYFDLKWHNSYLHICTSNRKYFYGTNSNWNSCCHSRFPIINRIALFSFGTLTYHPPIDMSMEETRKRNRAVTIEMRTPINVLFWFILVIGNVKHSFWMANFFAFYYHKRIRCHFLLVVDWIKFHVCWVKWVNFVYCFLEHFFQVHKEQYFEFM